LTKAVGEAGERAVSFVFNIRVVCCVVLTSIFILSCANIPADDDIFKKSVEMCEYKNDRIDRSRSTNQNAYQNCVDSLRAIPISEVSGVDKIDRDRVIFVQIVDGHGLSYVSPGFSCLEEEIFKRQYVYISHNVESSISDNIKDYIENRNVVFAMSNKFCTPFSGER